MNKCIKVVSKNKKKIYGNILEFIKRMGVEYEEIYLYKSRVADLCRKNSDIDIFILLSEKHREMIERKGKMWDKNLPDLKYVSWSGDFAKGLSFIDKVYGEEYPNGWWPIDLDIRMGCDMPPRPEKYIDRKFIIRFEEVP